MYESDESLKDLQKIYADNEAQTKGVQFEALKLTIKDWAIDLQACEIQKKKLAFEQDIIQKKITHLTDCIRKAWAPFVVGSDEATLDLGEVTLKLKAALNVGTEDKEQTIEWLVENGYKEVMKWDIHHATLKSIATELYQNKQNPTSIPGLSYKTFNIIKVK